MKRVGIIGGGNTDLAEKVAEAVNMADENNRKCVVLGDGESLTTPFVSKLKQLKDDLFDLEHDLSNVNPRSFYRKPKLSPKQVKARKASKQAKKSRKTNRRK